MALIFWISTWVDESLTPEKGFGFGIPSPIKHMGEFGILGVLMANVVFQISNQTKGTLSAIIFSGFYGIFDEIHQAFIPSRFCTVNDMTVNALGAMAGVVFFLAIRRKINHD